MKKHLEEVTATASLDRKVYDEKVATLKSECSQKIKAANDRADETEKKCFRDNFAAAKARREGEGFRDEQQRLLKEEQAEIDKLAEQKIVDIKAALSASKQREISAIEYECQSKIKKHKNYYASKYLGKETWHILVFVFCIVWLVIQALSSNYFRHEAMKMGTWIKDYVVYSFYTLDGWVNGAANITSGISNEIVATILYWIIYGIVAILGLILWYGIPLVIIGGGSFLYLKSEYFDKANRWIMIASGILLVAMSSEMFYTPSINLLVLWLMVQLAVPLLRYVIFPLICASIDEVQSMDEDKKRNFYYIIMMVVVVICGFFLIIWSLNSFAADLSNLSK